MLAHLPTASNRAASRPNLPGPAADGRAPTVATWSHADPTQRRQQVPVAIHETPAPARSAHETRLELPDQSMLPLGASRQQLERRLSRYLSDDLYAGLRTDRNGRQFDSEIGRIASRLASVGLEPEAIRELYDECIHRDDQRALILENVSMALPYQAASWVAAQFGLPALAHLPLFARSAAVALATAAFDEGAQGLVRGTAARKDLAHHRPAGSFPPLLRRLLMKEASESGRGVWGRLGTAAGGITLKNGVRTGLSVGAAAFGMSNAAIGAVGAVTDLVGGTGVIAGLGVRDERKDQRAGLQWLLAFDGAPSVLTAAAQARQAAPMSLKQRAAAAGASLLQTSQQAASATPQALRAVFGPGTLVKAAGLTVINALGELGTEHVRKVYGEKVPPGDLSARRRRDAAEHPTDTGGPTEAAVEAPVEPVISRRRLLEGVAAEHGIATALGIPATAWVEGANLMREAYDKRIAKALGHEGLRHRAPATRRQ